MRNLAQVFNWFYEEFLFYLFELLAMLGGPTWAERLDVTNKRNFPICKQTPESTAT